MPNPSHIDNEKLEKISNIADFAQVNVSRAKLLFDTSDHLQKEIESSIQEQIALTDAKRLLSDERK
jgi:hypothetical protein